jgi:protein TonB
MNLHFKQHAQHMKESAWGLTQGLLGARQQALSPSFTALGPNTYLTPNDFVKMLTVAFVLHALVLGIFSLMPREQVTDIPVRAINFKIGGNERIAAFGVPLGVGTTTPQPQPITPPASVGNQEWRAAPAPAKPAPAAPVKPKPKPKEKKKKPQATPVSEKRPAPVQSAQEAQRTRPMQNPVPLDSLLAKAEPAPQPTTPPASNLASLPSPSLLNQPAIAPSPQRFIREAGTAGTAPLGQDSAAAAAQSAEAVRARYEQVIAGWIQKHYPQNIASGSRKLRPVIRMRIDRTGYVRYYAIEQTSGSQALDSAAIDLIRRANPMPAVPPTYPAGNLIEFVIPIVFFVP